MLGLIRPLRDERGDIVIGYRYRSFFFVTETTGLWLRKRMYAYHVFEITRDSDGNTHESQVEAPQLPIKAWGRLGAAIDARRTARYRIRSLRQRAADRKIRSMFV